MRSALHGGDEAVPTLRDGFDEARLLGGIAEHAPKPDDGVIEAVLELDEGLFRPERLFELVSRDDVPGLAQEDGE
jgi:hypothetical protein